MLARLRYRRLAKDDFLELNSDAIGEYLSEISDALKQRYGTNFRPVTWADTWVLTYVEAGLSPGTGFVDRYHPHSLGEIGLFPLPSRIRDWNGSSAPQWNARHALEQNVYHFLLYLGHLKNKHVKTIDGMKLYRELFPRGTAAATVERNARILAGVVHGYFYKGNYDDRVVPLDHLIAGYTNNDKLPDILAPTKYVHARSSIITNRANNIEMALRLMRASASV